MERRTERVSDHDRATQTTSRTIQLPIQTTTSLPGMRSNWLPVHVRRARRRRAVAAALFAADALATVLGFVLAYVLRYKFEVGGRVLFDEPLPSFIPTIVLLLASTLTLLWSRGAYHQPRSAGWLAQLGPVGSSVVTAVGFTIIITFVYQPNYYSRLIFFYAGLFIFALLALNRLALVRWRRWHWRRGKRLERVLVVGGAGLSRRSMASLANSANTGYDLVGYVCDPPGPDAPSPRFGQSPTRRQLGSLDALPAAIVEHQIDHVIVALPFWQHRDLPRVAQTCNQLGVDFQVVPDFFELSFDRVTLQEIAGTPLIELRNNQITGTNYLIKRILDLGLVLATLPIWGVVSLIIAIVIMCTSKGPVIYRQTRIGRHGHPFEFLKFRTMIVNADEMRESLLSRGERNGPLYKIKHDPRITQVGRFLRKYSLDEIPQFWNVLRGDISLVGPRPAIPEEVFQYQPWQRRRLDVTPGITGLAQAMGRSDIGFEEMVRLDIYYAEHWSVWLDIRIMLATIPTVLSGRGSY